METAEQLLVKMPGADGMERPFNWDYIGKTIRWWVGKVTSAVPA